MRCQQIKEKFADFLIGDIGQKTKEKIQSHLTACTSCRDELESLSLIWAKLGVLPEEHPSSALRTRFYSMLEAYKQGIEQEKSAPRLQKLFQGLFERWWPKRPAFQFSLAFMLLMVGLAAGYFLNVTRQSSKDLVHLRQEVQSMHQMLAVSLIDQKSPSERLRGINLSYRMERPEVNTLAKLLHTLNSDQNVNVRLAAVDALYLFHDYPMVKEGLTQSLSNQTSPLVQVALVDLIVELRERRAVEALKQLIQDEELNPEVRNRAEQGIQQLSY